MENLFGEKIEKEVWQEDGDVAPIDIKSFDISWGSSADPIITVTYLNDRKTALHYSELPKDVVEYMNKAFNEAMKTQDVKKLRPVGLGYVEVKD